MPRTGRPRVLDATRRGQVCVLLAEGWSRKDIARYLGCAPCTLRREVLRNEQFRDELADAKRGFERHFLETMIRAAATKPEAARWVREYVRPMEHVDPYSDPPYEELDELLLPPLPGPRARKSRRTFAHHRPKGV